jgi:GntR family transcriptional regulator
LDLRIDPASPVPLYLQVIEQISRLIARGALRPGDRLPPVRDLAVRCRINRNTAARAIQELEAAGIVRTRIGQGTFVVDGAKAIDPGKREAAIEAAVDRLVVEAATLGVPLEELGWRLSRRIDAFRRGHAAKFETKKQEKP